MISVIVPIFNVADYLEKCINSICAQTYDDIEIVLVDDGSTDGSGEICDAYAQKDTRIVVIHKENQGLVRARKDGLRRSTGEMITYVDGDDWIEENMLENLYDIMIKEVVDIVIHGRYFDINGKSYQYVQGINTGRYDEKEMRSVIFPRMIVNEGFMEWGIYPNVWDKLFRREVLYDAQMMVNDGLTMGEDAACVYPCILDAHSIFISDQCFYHYRQLDSSMVRSKKTSKAERAMYRLLYYSVNHVFLRHNVVYNLGEQWKKYLLFLMVPRADELYENLDHLDYLFPYPNVKKGDSVLIYGAGVYGKRLYQYLCASEFCDVRGIVDRDYMNLRTSEMNVLSPDMVTKIDVMHIIVAISFEKTRNAVCKYLREVVDESKICVMDLELIMSPDTWRAFGLEEGV